MSKSWNGNLRCQWQTVGPMVLCLSTNLQHLSLVICCSSLGLDIVDKFFRIFMCPDIIQYCNIWLHLSLFVCIHNYYLILIELMRLKFASYFHFFFMNCNPLDLFSWFLCMTFIFLNHIVSFFVKKIYEKSNEVNKDKLGSQQESHDGVKILMISYVIVYQKL